MDPAAVALHVKWTTQKNCKWYVILTAVHISEQLIQLNILSLLNLKL